MMGNKFLFKLILFLLSCFIITTKAQDPQIIAVQGLIERVVPKYQNVFQLELIPSNNGDVFQIQSNGTQVVLRGINGVGLASALHYYLKYFCNCQVSWTGDQLNLPATPPAVPTLVSIAVPMTYRYYFNVCTFGYSTVWWDWARWQREIDWMALNGMNLPLAFIGQETIWRQLYIKLGLSDNDLADFFTGPAFLPWQRMGNVNGWAGPLSQNWLNARAALQVQILTQMRSYGMTPVLPAFAGHVPQALKSYFPDANITQLSSWGGFNGTYLLAPTDPLFSKIGTMFIQLQTAAYGTDHYYNTDLFNELTPPSSDPTYLASTSKAVYSYMLQADSLAVWVMQGWFLVNDGGFWKPAQTQAFLNSVPEDNLLMLDLWADVRPVWNSSQKFYGKKFIWNMLHNFGGRTGMYGTLQRIASLPAITYSQADNLVGMGLTPEAIETNVIVYDLMMEMPWRVGQNKEGLLAELDTWVQNFTVRRYSIASSEASTAWNILQNTIYNCNTSQDGTTYSMIGKRPVTSIPSNSVPYYDVKVVPVILQHLINAASQTPSIAALPTFQHDIASVTRQLIGDAFLVLFNNMMSAFHASDSDSFNSNSKLLLQAILDTDTIVSTQSMWLVGNWITDAKQWGVTPAEIAQYEFNARNQITLWGHKTSGLVGYAYKLWGGLVKDFYYPRWSLFVSQLSATLSQPTSFNYNDYVSQVEILEYNWCLANNSYATSPSGDAVGLASQMLETYKAYLS